MALWQYTLTSVTVVVDTKVDSFDNKTIDVTRGWI